MNEQLWKLLQKARTDAALRQRIWETQKDDDPALALCLLAEAEGFPVSVGELFAEGEEFCSNLRKSCNGGRLRHIFCLDGGFRKRGFIKQLKKIPA